MHEQEPPLPCSPEVRSENWNRGLARVLAIETRFSIIGYWRPGIAGCRREPKRPLARRPLLVTGRGGDIGLEDARGWTRVRSKIWRLVDEMRKRDGGKREGSEGTNRDPLALLADTIGTCSRTVPFLAEEMRGGSEFPRKCLRGEGNKLFVFFCTRGNRKKKTSSRRFHMSEDHLHRRAEKGISDPVDRVTPRRRRPLVL